MLCSVTIYCYYKFNRQLLFPSAEEPHYAVAMPETKVVNLSFINDSFEELNVIIQYQIVRYSTKTKTTAEGNAKLDVSFGIPKLQQPSFGANIRGNGRTSTSTKTDFSDDLLAAMTAKVSKRGNCNFSIVTAKRSPHRVFCTITDSTKKKLFCENVPICTSAAFFSPNHELSGFGSIIKYGDIISLRNCEESRFLTICDYEKSCGYLGATLGDDSSRLVFQLCPGSSVDGNAYTGPVKKSDTLKIALHGLTDKILQTRRHTSWIGYRKIVFSSEDSKAKTGYCANPSNQWIVAKSSDDLYASCPDEELRDGDVISLRTTESHPRYLIGDSNTVSYNQKLSRRRWWIITKSSTDCKRSRLQRIMEAQLALDPILRNANSQERPCTIHTLPNKMN